MTFFEFIVLLTDLFFGWRLWVCVVPALFAAVFLHNMFPDAQWTWLISVPLVVGAFVVGARWESKSA